MRVVKIMKGMGEIEKIKKTKKQQKQGKMRRMGENKEKLKRSDSNRSKGKKQHTIKLSWHICVNNKDVHCMCKGWQVSHYGQAWIRLTLKIAQPNF